MLRAGRMLRKDKGAPRYPNDIKLESPALSVEYHNMSYTILNTTTSYYGFKAMKMV